MEIGPLVSCEIHYDKSGRSLGSGSVVFDKRTDALRAINQYNGVPLDGKSLYPTYENLIVVKGRLRTICLRIKF